MDELKVVTWRIPKVRAADLERVTVPAQERAAFLDRIAQGVGCREVVYLPTCQRVILATLSHAPSGDVGSAALAAFAERAEGFIPEPEVLTGYQAFSHLAEVASSLDSLVPGETQILGQMKDAYQEALDHGFVGKPFNHIFQLVFRTAKRVRTDTALFEGKVSLIPLTLDLVEEACRGRERPRAVVVGTGTIGTKMLEHLASRGIDLVAVSRTPERAREVAKQYGATPRTLAEFLADPPAAHVVALAARADEPFLWRKHAEALAQDGGTLVLDLALPRNSSEDVGEAPHVRLVQMDDLNALSEAAKQRRHEELSRARDVLQAELDEIRAFYDNLHVDREVVALREAMLAAAGDRLDRGARELKNVPVDDPEFRKWYEQTIRHLVHVAQTRLRRVHGAPAKSSEEREA